MLSNAVIAAFGVVYKSDPPPNPRLRQGLYGERHGGIGKARRSESPVFFGGGQSSSLWRMADRRILPIPNLQARFSRYLLVAKGTAKTIRKLLFTGFGSRTH